MESNVQKMREALESVRDKMDFMSYHAKLEDEDLREPWIVECLAKIDAALAAPPRNCDVGTPEEQSLRFDEFCERHCLKDCSTCPAWNLHADCEIVWAQMPYEKESEAAK